MSSPNYAQVLVAANENGRISRFPGNHRRPGGSFAAWHPTQPLRPLARGTHACSVCGSPDWGRTVLPSHSFDGRSGGDTRRYGAPSKEMLMRTLTGVVVAFALTAVASAQ